MLPIVIVRRRARRRRTDAAIGGTMIAFGWISNKRKSWPKKDAKS
jgi:hypothetical protein